MAKDIDITLPDGGEITVPGWSTEETQKQIYTLLKSMEGVDKETVKKLEEAQRSDDKNSKKEIEALKEISKDLKESNKAGFLGAMAMAAGAAGSALGLMGKAVGITAGAVTVMGGALVAGAKGVTSFATAYTDAIKPLAQTGVAFGSLGNAVDQSVMDLNSLGFSSAEAAKLINNSGTAFLRLGADGLAEFTKTMRTSAKEFQKFGMTTDEATEYLATELEERARAGIVEKLSASQMANLQMNILNDQIQATRRLGQSVDEIADFQKQVQDDPRIAGIINAFSGNADQERMIKSLITQLQAVPGLDGTDVADIISAQMEGRGIESTEAYGKVIVAMSQVPGALENFKESANEGFQAVATNNVEAFEKSQKTFDKSLSDTGKTIDDLLKRAAAGEQDARGVITTLNSSEEGREFVRDAAVLAGLVERTAQVQTELTDTGDAQVNKTLAAATEFDNTMIEITGAFTEQITASQQAMVDGLDAVTTALVDSGIKDGAKGLATALGTMAVDGIETMTGKLQETATQFANFAQELPAIYDERGLGGVSERIYQATLDNIIKPISSAIYDAFVSPTVLAGIAAAVIIPFGAQVVATALAMAIGKRIGGYGAGGGTDGVVPGTDGGAGRDKDGKAKGGGRFGGRGALLAGGALTALTGVIEAVELAGDVADINKDLKEGAITRSDAQIAKTTEIAEGVGGTAMGVGGAMAAGAALGSMGMPVVGTAIGAAIAGGIAWWAGRKGARVLGEGLGEAVFTPEQEALELELAKIEERLSGDINRRTRQQLETRQKQVEAELELMKPLEISSPVNPNNIPIMTTYTRDDEVIPPGVDDAEIATKKQTQSETEMNNQIRNQQEIIEKLNQSLDSMIIELQGIKTNTGKTNKGLSAIADTQ